VFSVGPVGPGAPCTAEVGGRNMRILLVEDHLDIAGIVFDYFELKGYELDHAANGEFGLELGLANSYDLIVLDIMLPRMDGLTVCRAVLPPGCCSMVNYRWT